jgi:hypothetical protein
MSNRLHSFQSTNRANRRIWSDHAKIYYHTECLFHLEHCCQDVIPAAGLLGWIDTRPSVGSEPRPSPAQRFPSSSCGVGSGFRIAYRQTGSRRRERCSSCRGLGMAGCWCRFRAAVARSRCTRPIPARERGRKVSCAWSSIPKIGPKKSYLEALRRLPLSRQEFDPWCRGDAVSDR